MELFLLYLWLKLDSIITVLGFVCFLSVVALGIYYICRSVDYCDNYIRDRKESYVAFDAGHKNLKKYLVLAIPFSLITAVALPDSKDTAILVGASYAIDLAKSPEGVKVQSLIRKKANEYLDEALKEKGTK